MFLWKKQTYIFQGLALSRFVWLLPYLALPTTCSTSGSCDLECALVSSFFRSRISRSWGFCVEAPFWSACSSLTPVRACCHAVSLVQQPFPGWGWGYLRPGGISLTVRLCVVSTICPQRNEAQFLCPFCFAFYGSCILVWVILSCAWCANVYYHSVAGHKAPSLCKSC